MENERTYWSQHFPWKSITRFLCQGGSATLERREIAIRKPSFFQRNVAFKSLEDLKKSVIGNRPRDDPAERLEFGPIFPGTERKNSRQEKDISLAVEFRFDVDVKDYSNEDKMYGKGCLTCTHFSNAPACEECWKNRLEPSRKVLEYLLTEMLGAQHILWVFSGKKGYHGIVLDKNISSKFLPNETRKNIVDRLIDPKDERMLAHIYGKILWPIFKQQYLDVDVYVNNNPIEVFYGNVRRPLNILIAPKDIFDYIKKDVFGGDDFKMRQHYRKVMRTLYWPRLDAIVSANAQHLLKIPFSIHDETKNISTPILDTENFMPENALTLEDVCQDPRKLEPYVKYFEELMNRAYSKGDESSSSDDDDDVNIITCSGKRKKEK